MLRTSRRSVRVGETLLSSLLQRSPFSCILIHPASTAALQRLPINVFSSRNAIYNEAAMIRFFCSSRSSDAQRKTEVANVLPHDEKDSSELVYQAPMARAVRLMKAVSVTSCTLTSLGMPILCIISPQDTSMLAKWAMCGTIMLFGLGTTSLFHFLFQPYVMRMWLVGPATDYHGATSAESTMTVETVTLFAQLQQHSFRLSDVSPPTQAMHPMVSFQACGRHYFIHPESFEDRKLLSHLVGSKASKLYDVAGSNVTEVPFQKLRDRGFRGVIFDKDNTLTIPHEIAIPSHFASSLDECRRVFGDSSVVVFSNSAGSVDDKDGNQATKIEEELQVAVLRHKHKKPGGITCVQKHFEKLNPQTLVIIGDRYSTDVLFGNLNGLLTIRTEQFLPESESFVNRQLQRIEKAAVRMLISAGVKPPTHPLWDNIEA